MLTCRIDLSRKCEGKRENKSIEKCREELSSQKKMLLRELERKEEKMTELRETYRKIQTSKEKDVKMPSHKHKSSIQSKLLDSDRSTRNDQPSARRTARSPHPALSRNERMMLFPSKT